MKSTIVSGMLLLCLIGTSPAFSKGNWELLQCVNNITDISRDGDTMWVSTFGDGVYHFDAKTMKRYNYCRANSILPDDSVNEAAKDKKGNLWVATEQAGLARIGQGGGKVFSTSNSKIPSNTVNSIAVDSNNTVWVSTAKGIVSIDNDSVSPVYQLDQAALPAQASTLYAGTRIVVDKYNNKVAGTSEGIMIIRNNGSIMCYTPANSCLKSSYVMYLAIDQSQKIWASTHSVSGGLFASLSGTGVACLGTVDCFTMSNTGSKPLLSSNNAICIAVAPDSLKWVGTSDNGITVIDDRDGVTVGSSFIPASDSGVPFSRIQPICFDAVGHVWVGSRRQGLAVFNGTSWQKISVSVNKMPCNTTKQVKVDKNDRRWFLHEDEGFLCAAFTGITSTDGTRWNLFDSESDGLPTCNARIFIDPTDSCTVFFANSNVLYSIKKDSLKFLTTTTVKIDSATTVTCDYFGERTMAFDANGTIWFQCSTGIVEWKNRKDWVFHNQAAGAFLTGRKSGVAVTPNGMVWSAIYDSGFISYDHGSWKFMKYDSLPKNGSISEIIPDSKGGAWATQSSSSNSPGQSYFVYCNGTTYKNLDKGKFADYYPRQKCLDGSDRLWAMSSKGLLMSDGDSMRLFTSGSAGLQTSNFYRMCLGRDGTPYFCGATQDWAPQIYSFNDTVFTLLTQCPFTRFEMYDFAMDSKDNFFIATSNGILSFNPQAQPVGLRETKTATRGRSSVRMCGNAVSFNVSEPSECIIEVMCANGRILSSCRPGMLKAGVQVIPFSRFSQPPGSGNGVRFVRVRTTTTTEISPWLMVR